MALKPINHILVCNRRKFNLVLWQRPLLSSRESQFEPVARYEIAIGQLAYPTPPGVYLITQKSKRPTWTVPDSEWAIEDGLIPGTVVPYDPPPYTGMNPIKARWMGIADGVGIHGTTTFDSLGGAYSHGCLRMRPDDIISLYPQVPKYTPIHIL